jgi:alpha-glucosidase (family GH31 glycosyl hydrolase)
MFPHFEQMKDAMVLRNSLAPYIYTAARQHYDLGVSLLRPLYWEHPEDDQAYNWADTQYYFGDSVLVAPIATAGSSPDPYNGSTYKQLWLPTGTWVAWGGETTHVGPKVLSQNYSLSEIPMFVSAGAVVPLKTMASVSDSRPDPLVWAIFIPSHPSSAEKQQTNNASVCAGEGEVYEDDGETTQYENTPGERLRLAYVGDWAEQVVVTITPPPTTPVHATNHSRGYVLQLRGLHQHKKRMLTEAEYRVGGTEAESLVLAHFANTAEAVENRASEAGWWTHVGHSLSTPHLSTIVNLGQQPSTHSIEVTLRFAEI